MRGSSSYPPPWRIAPHVTVTLADGRSVVLRPVTVDDADRMAEFFGSLGEREIYYFFHLDKTAARQLALNVDQAPAYRLIALGMLGGCKQVLGYTFLHWQDDGPPVFGICLRSDVQSHGLGWQMMDHLLTSAAASGVDRVRLTVHPDNWRALRLYQAAGFRIVDEFINQHQGVKQYRMEADLQSPRPRLSDECSILPSGGIGVGLAAADIQAAIERTLGWRPLILDHPPACGGRVIFVAELAMTPDSRAPTPVAISSRTTMSVGWIVSLDMRHLLIGGTEPEAVRLAARHYTELVTASGPSGRRLPMTVGDAPSFDGIPFDGLHLCLESCRS